MNKKIWSLASIAMVMVMVLSGCGASANTMVNGDSGEDSTGSYIKNVEQRIEAAQKQLYVNDSFVADFYAEAYILDGEPTTITKAKVSKQEEPYIMAVETETDYGTDSNTTSNIYLEVVDGKANLYMAYDGQWTEMTMEEAPAQKTVCIYDIKSTLTKLLSTGQDWKEVSEKDGVVTVSGTIPKEKIFEVADGANLLQLAGMSGIGEVYYATVQEVPIELRLNADGTPLSYSLDLTDVLEKVMNQVLIELSGDGELMEPMDVQKYVIRQEFTNFSGSTVIEMPQGAKSAINYESEIQLMESSMAKSIASSEKE